MFSIKNCVFPEISIVFFDFLAKFCEFFFFCFFVSQKTGEFTLDLLERHRHTTCTRFEYIRTAGII